MAAQSPQRTTIQIYVSTKESVMLPRKKCQIH